jgi:hypothetical protein
VKHYLKERRERGSGGPLDWLIRAGDLDEGPVDELIACLDTETLADALMQVLTSFEPPFEEGKPYEGASAISGINEWESRNGYWIFGAKVRGVTRIPLASVTRRYGCLPWCWWTFDDAGKKTGNGRERSFIQAVAAAEKALGL